MRMWMVRGDSGELYDDFRERGVAAIGWTELVQQARLDMSRTELIELNKRIDPQAKPGSVIAGASQVWRFINEIEVGDWVVTYSPGNRTYLIGKVTGAAQVHSEWAGERMILARPVAWEAKELERDALSTPTKNSLGSTLTVFALPQSAEAELVAQLEGKVEPKDVENELLEDADEASVVNPLQDTESQSLEQIKDMVSSLNWDQMQQLVAGILRAMKYKTQISAPGSDRGKDIIASPDGFGFESPRIVVEVKHRSGKMDSKAVRSFPGGRHKDDRGLYVSTGGFTKDAYYEAERTEHPLVLWTLDNLVRALLDHYDATDAETKRLVPLKKIYLPV